MRLPGAGVSWRARRWGTGDGGWATARERRTLGGDDLTRGSLLWPRRAPMRKVEPGLHSHEGCRSLFTLIGEEGSCARLDTRCRRYLSHRH